MALFEQPQSVQTGARAGEVDAGLRAYMLKIYNYMASALVLTGLVSYFAGSSPAFINAMVSAQGGLSGLGYVVIFAPLAFILLLNFGIHRLSEGGAQIAFWAFAVVMGLSLWSVGVMYTGESIARTFFITAGAFGGLSLYGYTTKRDLSGFGTFLIMGVWGLVLASIVNIFMQSTGLQFAISAIGVLVFSGLIAYDTQRLKVTYYQLANYGTSVGKAAILGALSLYLDFINLFMMLLRFAGDRR